jgi:HTH-type transcriptional regulator/antitoxin HipB
MNEIVRSPKQLGALIHRARVGRAMSQQDLADLIGTYQKTISAIEKGSPGAKLETMFSLLAALDLDLELVPRRKGSVDLAEIF